jgi:alpha-beta hydrolase superfamily lysophospholipase
VPFDLWRNPDGSDRTFADYVSQTTRRLQADRWEIPEESEAQRKERIERISPHEWPLRSGCGGRASAGVLLVHGLTDSPYLMRDLGDFFRGVPGACYLVRSILLPGHGTRPGDLLEVQVDDWHAATRYGIRSFAGRVSDLHIVGFSTGAALAIYEALATEPSAPRIRSLILLSPLIRPHGVGAQHHLIARLIVGARRLVPRWRWMEVGEDRDYAKYESFPANAAYQVLVLADQLATKLTRNVPVPVFAALVAEDQTVSVDRALEFFLGRTDPSLPGHLVLYVGSGPAAVEYKGKVVQYASKYGVDPARVAVVEVSQRSDDGRVVRELSHTSTPVAPSNPHYGANGDYANCLHYRERGRWDRYCACLPPAQRGQRCAIGVREWPVIQYGERSRENVERADMLVRRQTYNTKFPELLDAIQRFLEAFQVGRTWGE